MPKSRPINYYDILGVAPGAATREIRSAYLARIGEYHPDRNQTTHATAIAALINEAWTVLGDADRRRHYDANTAVHVEPASTRPARQPQAAEAVRPSDPVVTRPPRPPASRPKRRDARLKTLLTIRVASDGRDGAPLWATCTCVDLSTTGMAFSLDAPLGTAAPLTVTLDLPGGFLDVRASVVRCEPLKRPGRWKVALAFVDLGESARRRITQFVERESNSRLG